MEDDSNLMQEDIEIIGLSSNHIPGISPLLAHYLFSSCDEQQMSECVAILERLLDSQLAQLLVARKNGEYMGFMILDWGFSTSKGLPILRVQALYTVDHLRQSGVATALLHRAKEIAEEHGACRLQLETDHDNTPAQSLYTKLGFILLPQKQVYMLFL